MSVLPDSTRPVPWSPPPTEPYGCEVTSPHPGLVLVRILGDVDLGSIGPVEDTVRVVLRRRPQHVVVDLSGMGFCGLRGLALLVTARASAAALGVGYAVCGAPVQAIRVWSLLWEPAERPPLRPDVATAVRAALSSGSAGQAGVQHGVAELPRRVDVAEQGLGVG